MSSYVAGKMASRKVEGVLAPLLEESDEESTDAGSSASDDGSAASVEQVKQTPLQKLKATVVYAGLLGGTALSAAAIVLCPHIATFVMGGVCAANAPYSVVKERQIAAIPSLRSLNNKLREDARQLEAAVDDLADEIDLLGPEADRAAVVEDELRGIADAQEVNVNRIVELVKENADILAKMRDNLRQRIVQDTIHIVVASDRDNNQNINMREAMTLALRIRLSLQEYGVLFDSDKFLRAIGGDTTVAKVVAIVQRLLPKERAGSDTETESDDEDCELYDMFHMIEEGSAASDGSTIGGQGVSLMTCDRERPAARRRPRRAAEEISDDSDSEVSIRDY